MAHPFRPVIRPASYNAAGPGNPSNSEYTDNPSDY
jgi:hypothetical protein